VSAPRGEPQFAAFVRIGTPPIPHRNAKADGSGQVTLAEDAPDAIDDAIYSTARMLVEQNTSSGFGTEKLAQYRPHFSTVAGRFAQFLTTGLATGDAPWPGTNFNP
jgi:hypothetical protein